MQTTPSRRDALKGLLTAGAAPLFIPASVRRAVAQPVPSERITLGMIGLGSMGMRHVEGFLQETDCRITAVCDVDAKRRTAAADRINAHYGNTDCLKIHDFRELLQRDDLDTVCISVPDHWHAVLALAAIRAGKDVYGEKPLARTVVEGRAICDAVKRHNCVWETGSWQRSTAHFRFGCELVRNGRIGALRRVEVGIGIGPTTGNHPTMPVPAHLDYDMWLGPAPWAPYTEQRCHWNFRWVQDYSGGQPTDWGAHHIDIAHWGMGVDDTGPIAVSGTGVFPEDGLWDTVTTYRFDCTYASGVRLAVASNNQLKQGVRFIGDGGWIHITRSNVQTHPASLRRDTIGPREIHLARPRGDHRQGHRRDFLDCVKTRARTITDAEIGHRSITVGHLGNIAMLLGRKIRWDPQREQILNDDTASRMLLPNLRAPWRL